jgi:hypothetical protein
LEYGKPLDVDHLKEELGDVLWRIVQACDATGLTLEDVMRANLAKLAVRFPEKYTDFLADEEHRNRKAERKALENEKFSHQTGQGWAEPPEEKELPICKEPDMNRAEEPHKSCIYCGRAVHRKSPVGYCTSCGIERKLVR